MMVPFSPFMEKKTPFHSLPCANWVALHSHLGSGTCDEAVVSQRLSDTVSDLCLFPSSIMSNLTILIAVFFIGSIHKPGVESWVNINSF
jgi:hypothetical protein